MAILDGVKNAVTSQVAARANSQIRSGLTKVAGNLLGINTQSSGPQLGAAQKRYTPNKYTTKNLAYPIDVEADPRQSHYIFFTILQQTQAELDTLAEKQGQNFKDLEKSIANEVSGVMSREKAAASGGWARNPHSVKEVREEVVGKLAVEDLNLPDGEGKSSSSLRMRTHSSTHAVSHIALYMPGSVQVSYGADYQDSEIGVFAQMGAGAIQAFKEGADFEKTVEELVNMGSSGLRKGLLATLDTVAPGSKAVAQITSGRAITPKMELMFNGIGRREFSYEFTFMPKSVEEAQMVREIIYEFKYYMSANFTKDGGFREMYLPNTFEISYMYMKDANENLNKISQCVLESADVTYGGDRFQTHDDGVPQKTKLTLKFKELEIITKDMIADGY